MEQNKSYFHWLAIKILPNRDPFLNLILNQLLKLCLIIFVLCNYEILHPLILHIPYIFDELHICMLTMKLLMSIVKAYLNKL